MARGAVITRRGQTTIPIEVRRKLGIGEGTRLKVEVVEGKVVLTKIPSVFDLAGTSKGTVKGASDCLDAIREEEG